MIYRKGALGTGLFFFVYFLMMAIIVAGLYGGLIAYFGKGYDSRTMESRILLKEIRECLDREFLDYNSISKEIFFDKCGISPKVIEDGDHIIFINNSQGLEFSVGATDYRNRCFFDARIKNNDLPACEEYVSNDYYILVGSAQNSRRIST